MLTTATILISLSISTLNYNKKESNLNEISKKYMSYQYHYGSKGKNKEVDCSGLVYNVYKDLNITVNKNIPLNVKGYSNSKEFKHIKIKNIRKGDIIVWKMNDNCKSPDHITIYLGNNMLLSAENEILDVIKVPCFIKRRPLITKGKYTWYNRYNKKRIYLILRKK